MKKQTIFPLLLLVAFATSVAAAPATEAAIFGSSKGIKINRLKKPQAFGVLSSASADASISARAGGGLPSSASLMAPMTESVADNAKIAIAPYPGDDRDYSDYGQIEVDYHWSGELPALSENADVYRAIRSKPDTGLTKSLLKSAGLPTELANGISEVQSLNASWKGKNGITWNFDATNNNLSWWKEVINPQYNEDQPKLDEARAIQVAQDFVKAQGLSGYITTAPELEDAPWIRPLLDPAATSMPCPMVKEEPAMHESFIAEDAAITDRMIAPSPCFWYPRTVNIVYPDIRDGKRVTDAWSGYPQQALTVTVSLDTYEVTGGYANLPTSLEASSYPMISKVAVEESLKAGGRSPYYGWGKKGTRAQIQYNKLEQVVMRYDSWKDNKNETYFVPALLATGTIDAGDGNGLQDYRTIVPLIKAEFLEEVPNPIMYMKGGEGTSGASAGTVTNMAAPAIAPMPPVEVK